MSAVPFICICGCKLWVFASQCSTIKRDVHRQQAKVSIADSDTASLLPDW